MLDGEAELEVVASDGSSTRQPVTRGSVAYYPAGQLHTIHNPTARPVTYVMFRWTRRGPSPNEHRLEATVLRAPEAPAAPPDGALATRTLFEGATRHLRRLQGHISALAPGGGYATHADPYDLVLVVLSGELETGGRRVGPGAVVFFAAGERHGMKNVGAGEASYLVFELEGKPRLTALSLIARDALRTAYQRTTRYAPPALVKRVQPVVRRIAHRWLM